MANTRNFQFFMLGDTSVYALAGNLRKTSGMSLRMGFNFFFGNDDGYCPRGGEKYRYVNSF